MAKNAFSARTPLTAPFIGFLGLMAGLVWITSWSAYASDASVPAKINIVVNANCVTVHLSAQTEIHSFDRPTKFSSDSAIINQANVRVSDLRANVPAILPILKKKKFLDADDYPEVSVSNVIIKNDHTVSGVIHIKGIERTLMGTWSELPVEKAIQISINISLKDFDIADRFVCFKIADDAKIEIEMENPFVP